MLKTNNKTFPTKTAEMMKKTYCNVHFYLAYVQLLFHHGVTKHCYFHSDKTLFQKHLMHDEYNNHGN